ncbi:hypothetical protein BDW02DRAFT_573649 [Decorospora gaudefroyi]|uniref:Uncharacterized protein n=1 Tax=Decorospora gaudefroyi TaxID=184978 RepID=A0A6A5K4Z0_9PLEO|nr:hypothetical protein BDW02DRAFT_573649 [Decorospora gaudefroyi]
MGFKVAERIESADHNRSKGQRQRKSLLAGATVACSVGASALTKCWIGGMGGWADWWRDHRVRHGRQHEQPEKPGAA